MSFTSQTQMGKSPFQNLDAISALKEISDEAATICSGGAAIRLYGGRNFSPGEDGEFLDVNQSEMDLKNRGFDDKTSSINVFSGKWRFYGAPGFRGETYGYIDVDARKGSQSISGVDLDKLGNPGKGGLDNRISSIRQIF